MVRLLRFDYGWILVGLAVISLTIVHGIRQSFSVFFPSILGEFGWGRGSTAIMLSLNLLIYGFFSPLAGILCDRWKPRKIMLAGITILGLATASCAFAQELSHFYVLFGVLVSIGTAFSGWPLLAPTLANWFLQKRGLVIGLGQAGIGLSFAYGMFAEFTISHVGWRYAYFALAGTVFALLLPVYLFFHYRPEDRGLKAYGDPDRPTTPPRSVPEPRSTEDSMTLGWTLGQAMRTYQLWLLVLSFFLFWGIGCYLLLAHQIKFAQDAGYGSMFAASVFALFGIFMVVGQLSASISDWIGREKTNSLATILAIGSLFALAAVRDASQPWLLYVYATSFGFGAGVYAPTIFAGAADIFHGRHFGAISGLVLMGMGIGGAIGPWLGGYIYDISGSYRGAFVLSMACFGLACISFWVAAPRNAARLRTKM